MRERAIQQESLQRLPENPDLLKRLLAISLNYVSSEKKAGEELKDIEGRVIRGVGGWFKRPKKCLTPSENENSKNRLKIWQIPIQT